MLKAIKPTIFYITVPNISNFHLLDLYEIIQFHVSFKLQEIQSVTKKE